MEMRREELDEKQDEAADALCALLEKSGANLVFEIPEYARRRLDVSMGDGKVTGHFKNLVINDWKRKNMQEGEEPEPRITEDALLESVATFLESQGVRVFVDDKHRFYVLGAERYNGIQVEGYEEGHLYKLYSPGHTSDAYTVTSDGAPIARKSAKKRGKNIVLKGWFRSSTLRPYTREASGK